MARDGNVADSTLLEATRSYLDTCRRSGADAFVIDSLLPYTPSLLAWGRSDGEVAGFFASVEPRLRGFDALQVQLEGDASAGLNRAMEREGSSWLNSFVQKVGGYKDYGRGGITQANVIAYLDSATGCSRVLLAAAPWPVSFVSVDGGADFTLAEVLELLQR